MPGLPPDVVRASLRPLARWLLSPRISWETSRKRLELATLVPPPPRGTRTVPGSWGGVPGFDARPAGADDRRVLLYLHGGGYCTGTAKAYRGYAARIAAAAGARTVVLEYRMADEHRFPAAVDDALAAYRALLDEGVDPTKLVVAGDSAGGGLSLALAQRIRTDGLPQPAALGLICPWLDLTPEATGGRPDAPREPLLSRSRIGRFAASYLGDADPRDPLASPMFADLDGLPPFVVQVAGDDFLAPDGRAIAQRGRDAGLAVDEREFAGLWHDFHLISPLLAGEGAQALPAMGAALRRHMDAAR